MEKNFPEVLLEKPQGRKIFKPKDIVLSRQTWNLGTLWEYVQYNTNPFQTTKNVPRLRLFGPEYSSDEEGDGPSCKRRHSPLIPQLVSSFRNLTRSPITEKNAIIKGLPTMLQSKKCLTRNSVRIFLVWGSLWWHLFSGLNKGRSYCLFP